MYIQLNNWQAINLAQLQNTFDSGLNQVLTQFGDFDIYAENPSIYTNTQIAGISYSGYTYDVYGSGFTSSSSKSTFNYLSLINANSNLAISGSITYNFNNDTLSGYFSNFAYSSTNPSGLSQLSVAGKLNITSYGDLKGGSLNNVNVVADGNTVNFGGNIKLGSNANFSGGNVSYFTFADNLGHSLSISGGKINAAAFDNATDINALYAIINSPKYLKGNDTIVGDEQANSMAGYAGKDVLYGMSGNDYLDGGKGNDYLDGGTDADVMVGGKGADTYIVDNVNDVVSETSSGKSGGIDSVYASANFTLGANVEYLTLTGADNINGTGNGLKNAISGNSGNNIIDGGWGADKLYGGAGDDKYIVDIIQQGKSAAKYYLALQDTVTEDANAGNDTLILRGSYNHANATTFYLADSLESIDASQTGLTKLNLTGNASNNILTGNAADNIMNGAAGDDTLFGGLGNDSLTGSVGADTFKWSLADKGSNGAPSVDTITDFTLLQNDVLDLRDLLVGENSSNLLDYIDITTNAGNTEIHISSNGSFAGGNFSAADENAHITLTGVNLLNGTNEADLLASLITQNKLIIDI